MGFYESFQRKFKLYQDTKQQLNKDLVASAANAGLDAARSLVDNLKKMTKPDGDLDKILSHIGKRLGGTIAKDMTRLANDLKVASKDFAHNSQFMERNLSKLSAMAEDMSKRRAGLLTGWGAPEEAQYSADKMKKIIAHQQGILQETLAKVREDLDTGNPNGVDSRITKLHADKASHLTTQQPVIDKGSIAEAQIKSLQQQLGSALNSPATQAAILNQIKLKTAEVDAGKAAQEAVSEYDKLIEKENEHSRQLKIEEKEIEENVLILKQYDKSIKDLGERMKAAESQSKILGFAESMFGPIRKLTGFFGDLFGVIKAFISNPVFLAIAGIAAIFGVIWKLFDDAKKIAKNAKDAGLTASQVPAQLQRVQETRNRLFKKGIILSPDEASQAAHSVQQDVGRLNVPEKLLDAAGTLVHRFAIKADEAARGLGDVYRLYGGNAEKAEETVTLISAMAKKYGRNAGEMFSYMAQHMESLAKSGRMSMEAFARAADFSKQLHIDMGKFDSFADNLVSDFEGALKSQAEIQTLFPGADMSGVMYAAQFGDNMQLEESVKDMIQGIGQDFATLPRSFKLALERTTGFSSQDIGVMMGYSPEKMMAPAEKKEYEFRENFMNGVLNKMGDMLGLLGDISTSVLPIGGIYKGLAKTLFGDTTESKAADFQKMSQRDIALSGFDEKWNANTSEFQKLFGGAPYKYLSARSKFIEANHLDSESAKMKPTVPKGTTIVPSIPSTPQNQNNESPEKVSSIEPVSTNDTLVKHISIMNDTLQQLLSETKKGHVIVANGNKIAETIKTSTSRAV